MGVSIPAREAKMCPIGSYHYTCQGFEGCCEVNPCGDGRCLDEFNPYLTATELQAQKTIASVAAPVLVSSTASSSKATSTTTDKKVQTSTSSDSPTTTFSTPEPTETGGIWLTDDGGSASTITSDDPTGTPFFVSPHTYTPNIPVETQAVDASAPALAVKSDQHDLPVAAQAGIAVSALVVICMVIAAYFLCTKQRKKLRARESISSMSRDGRKHSSEDEISQPAMTTNPFCPEEVFSPYGRRYEEPQTRFNRVNDQSASRMMNHPVSPDTRESMSTRMPAMPPTPSPAMSPGTFRATTASPHFLSRTTTATPDLGYRTANSTPDFTSRMTTPDYMSRLGTATPELHGPPQQAAIAELASPGLPKVVEIHSSRSGLQKYKPYCPNSSSLYPVAETTPSYLTGTLNATEHERSQGRYVTSWSKWDPAT
ncbi:hypothetical protein BDP81DRAFT_448285 [Colletotrichum phormii]|uniref:Uncharacterized protein n=1 Tax=Colletotrichum phormii TaxID=359342 RepID=A0AAJ0EIL5_9PEZI|nr:uncharacterized protein BDP81DRAFT_448285 [Colletotrichum phormii]KAK1638201.1 hypothetical protein BDP81DRAFT_448285 [Colletotrichum phormii]